MKGRTPACRRCGHASGGHPAYIPGGDRPGYCTACRCWQYQPERPWTTLLAWLRKRPDPLQADVLRPRPVPLPVTDSPGGQCDQRTRLDIGIARPYAPGAARPPWEAG